mmetsp:Transcript_3575/g.7680  ORF Transcript_3575/g.7680 Transcript_3575/m.7680 type:complete len:422 (+) Transcript_3575:730-1995(+)
MEEAGEKLSQLTTTAIKLISKENYFSALDYLQVCEEILEDAPNPDMNLLVLNNIAVCYQKIGRLEECLKFVLACKKQTQSLAQRKDFAAKVNAFKQSCKYSAQACALMSQLMKHEDALVLAKSLMEDSKALLGQLKALCQDLSTEKRMSNSGRMLKFSDPSSILTSRPRIGKQETIEKAYEILTYLDDFMHQRPNLRPPDMSYRSALGIQKFNDWIFNYTIGTVMTVQLLSPLEAKTPATWESVLSKDALIHASSILIVSHFCLATEMRFIYSAAGDIGKVKESEAWHRRSIELASSLLPLECPLVEHLKVSYNRNYAVLLEEALNPSKSRLKVPTLRQKAASKTTFASPLRSDRSKSRTVTPIKSTSVERSSQRVTRAAQQAGRFESSPYLKRVMGKKITLETKRLIRPKFEAPSAPELI